MKSLILLAIAIAGLVHATPAAASHGDTLTLTLDHAAIEGGFPVTLTLRTKHHCVGQEATVYLSVDNPAVQLPNGGRVSVPFHGEVRVALTTKAVSAATQVAITTRPYCGTKKQTATLKLLSPIFGFKLIGPPSVWGGATAHAALSLAQQPGSLKATVARGAQDVRFSSSHPGVAAAPAAVDIGKATAVAIHTHPVAVDTDVVISARYAGRTEPVTLKVRSLLPLRIVCAPNVSVVAGQNLPCTVTLTGPAPAGGASIALASSSQSVVQVSAGLTIPEGVTAAPLTAVSRVTSDTPVTLSATYLGVTATTVLSVGPPVLDRLVCPGETTATGTYVSQCSAFLTKSSPPGGVTVTLASSNPAILKVPASIQVPERNLNAIFFVVPAQVATPTDVTLSATYAGVTKTVIATVKPIGLSALSLARTSIVGGGVTTGSADLIYNAPTGGVTVSLRSNNAAVQVPSTVTIQEARSAATFSITGALVSAPTAVEISASYAGATKTVMLTVVPLSAMAVQLAQGAVAGGTPVDATLVLNGLAPAGGVVVALSSDNRRAATVPASVAVPAGADRVTFPVTTRGVDAVHAAVVSAVYGGATRWATLTVTP